jgi:hypothetical protein
VTSPEEFDVDQAGGEMPQSIGFVTEGDMLCHGGQHWDRVVLRKFANGHAEASITRYKTLSELPPGYDPITGRQIPCEPQVGRGEGDREINIERATRRARAAARIRCKASGFDSLFTFTYRENVQDRELLARHWKEAVRRIRTVIPDFAYLAVVEVQKRGALHLHVATHRLPQSLSWRGVKVKSWSVLRAIWRSVVGPLGGNFDESKRRSRSRASSLRIARYITKYVSKEFDDGELNRKRYWAGGDWQAPERVSMLFPRAPGATSFSGDLIGLVFGEVVGPGAEYTHWLSPDGFVYWIAALNELPT